MRGKRRWRVQEQKERLSAAWLLEAGEQARLATGSNFLVRAGSGIRPESIQDANMVYGAEPSSTSTFSYFPCPVATNLYRFPDGVLLMVDEILEPPFCSHRLFLLMSPATISWGQTQGLSQDRYSSWDLFFCLVFPG